MKPYTKRLLKLQIFQRILWFSIIAIHEAFKPFEASSQLRIVVGNSYNVRRETCIVTIVLQSMKQFAQYCRLTIRPSSSRKRRLSPSAFVYWLVMSRMSRRSREHRPPEPLATRCRAAVTNRATSPTIALTRTARKLSAAHRRARRHRQYQCLCPHASFPPTWVTYIRSPKR